MVRWLSFYPVLYDQVLLLDVLPPCIDIFNEQMHHKIAGVIFVVKILQQEARISVPKYAKSSEDQARTNPKS
jgi:hypothetical protein